MSHWVNTAKYWLEDWLCAPLCLLCRYPIQPGTGLCSPCSAALRHNHPACRRCALPLTQPTHRYCSGCLWRTRALNRCYVPLRYEQPLQTLLQRWKFEPAPALSHVLAQLFTQSSVNNSPERPDVLVPVPLHWRRQWQRGFNQCDLLARALQRSCPTADGVPLCNNVIRRVRDTPPQRSLDADARRHNLTGAFALRRRALEGLHVALVDDVMTTGATAEALAQTLLQGGARRVDLWAIARTP